MEINGDGFKQGGGQNTSLIVVEMVTSTSVWLSGCPGSSQAVSLAKTESEIFFSPTQVPRDTLRLPVKVCRGKHAERSGLGGDRP